MGPANPWLVGRLILPSMNWVRDRDQAIDLRSGLLSFAAVLIWAASLSSVNVRLMNDLGLISVLPPAFFVALLLLTCGFCLALRRIPLNIPTMLAHVLALIVILYGTPALVEEVARFASTWSRVGIVDYIVQTGTVNPLIDAYFNWPGFFTASALFTQVAGISSLTSIVAWSNVFFNVLCLAPLTLIFSSMTRDRRLIWLGLWIFYLGNWVGQDYFAPQALDYVFYLVIVGVLLHWFKVTPEQPTPFDALRRVLEGGLRIAPRAVGVIDRLTRRDEMNTPSTAWQRVGLMFIVILVFAAMVPTHQLTPFGVLFVVAALVVFDRIRSRSLPVLMVAMVAGWISFMAVDYFTGHIASHMASVGAVDQTVQRGLIGRVKGSQFHQIVIDVRLALSVAIGVLALAGGLRRLRQGYQDLTPALMVAAPFFLIPVQGYGGEIFLRVYLYALPAMAFFAATLFYPSSMPDLRWRTSIAVGVVCLALIGSTFIARYGNERADMFTAQEIAAINFVYSTAPPGSLLLAPGNIPWEFQDYATYKYEYVKGRLLANDDVESLAQEMAIPEKSGKRAYLIITRSGKASVDQLSSMPTGSVDRFEKTARDSGLFTVVYSNQDAAVFVLADSTSPGDLKSGDRASPDR
jgi:hypothetical protein